MIDFAHISSFMLLHNDKVLSRTKLVQERKLLKIGFQSMSDGHHDPKKVIFNFSYRQLTESEEKLLSKGLNFSLPPKTLNYGDALLPFELLYKSMSNSKNIDRNSLLACRGALQNQAFNMWSTYNPKLEQNLTAEEIEALKSLKNDDRIVIQKSDKGNSVVILNKSTYIDRMEELLSDVTKFESISIQDGKDYNYIWNQELRVRETLKVLKSSNSIDAKLYDKLCPRGSRPSVMYGLAKVHKQLVNGFPKLRPILSAINTPTYKIAQFLVNIMEPLTKDQYTVKDSFEFCNDIRIQNQTKFMASFDIDSLFTNIPLDETITICCNKLFESQNLVEGLSKSQFRSLLELATKESFILFNGKYYKQIDGVAMGSPLGPTLANVFLCYHENNWLNQCPAGFKPLYFKRYVDDVFCLFNEESNVTSFLDYLNTCHPNMNFTLEMENENSLPFLDVNVIRLNDRFVTSVFRKATFSGIFTNFRSFIPELYKRNLISTLLFRSYTISSNWELVHKEVSRIKSFLQKNAYTESYIDNAIKQFFNKIFGNRDPIAVNETETHEIVLPYLGSISSRVRRNLKSLAKKYIPKCQIKIIFKSPAKLSSVFTFKDKLQSYLVSGVVYKYTCSGCNSTYIGKTSRHTQKRFSEHMGKSPLTGKSLKGQCSTTVRDHMLECNTTVCMNDFIIIGRDADNYKLRVKESIFILRDNPNLNIQGQSVPLTLF